MTKLDFDYAYDQSKLDEKTKNLHSRYRRRIHGVLLFLEKILRTARYINNLSITDRQNTRIQTTRVVRRHNYSNQGKHGRTRNGGK